MKREMGTFSSKQLTINLVCNLNNSHLKLPFNAFLNHTTMKRGTLKLSKGQGLNKGLNPCCVLCSLEQLIQYCFINCDFCKTIVSLYLTFD